MQPTFKDLNVKKTLLNTATINGNDVTEVNIKKLILRPVAKRIVFMTEEFDRVIVFEGGDDFEAHKGDSDDVLTAALLSKIDAEYKK